MNKRSYAYTLGFLLSSLFSLPLVAATDCFAKGQQVADSTLTLFDIQKIIERSEQNGEDIDLNALQELDADTARVVAETRGKLFLNGLTTMTPEVAEILAKHRGWLHLEGLRSMSPAVGKALSKHQGWLFLNGLRVLEEDVAVAILPYRGELYLDGVETITEEVAEILAKRQSGVELYGVQNINYRSVARLRRNAQIVLPSRFAKASWWPF